MWGSHFLVFFTTYLVIYIQNFSLPGLPSKAKTYSGEAFRELKKVFSKCPFWDLFLNIIYHDYYVVYTNMATVIQLKLFSHPSSHDK